jgi:putative ABC transport system substrate-binding protein
VDDPIVSVSAADPVAGSIVARLDRPSENVTGFALFEATLGGKWLELLSEIAPGILTPLPVSTYMPLAGGRSMHL